VLDTSRSYETPEGIVLGMHIAGPVVRAWAWAIDFAIRAGVYLVIAVLFSFLGGLGMAVILIGLFLVEWFYPVLFELRSGATPGKKAMGIQVVHDNGTPVSWSSSLIRNLVRAADFVPFLYGFGLLSMLANRDFKRLGDMAAGTLVVYSERPANRQPLPAADPIAPPGDLSVDEQRTLLAFAERSPSLTEDRCAELAGILADITCCEGQQAATRLHAYANYLAQGR
jgi:uncharacterized RDD family membrane protein YckC